jgi:hypothetical protein
VKAVTGDAAIRPGDLRVISRAHQVLHAEDSYRLCYVRGPEGIIVVLAEQLS